MICANVFCIYWINDTCTLDEISLDIQGNCKECIYVDLAEDALKIARDKILNCYKEAEV